MRVFRWLGAMAVWLAVAGGAKAESFGVQVTGTGPAVVLISGIGCGAELWKGTIARISGNHTCYAITLPGFDGQPAIQGALFDPLVAELEKFIADRKLDHPVLVGNDFGGLLALAIASDKPDVVGGVVTMATAPSAGTIIEDESEESLIHVGKVLKDIYSHMGPVDFKLHANDLAKAASSDPATIDLLTAMIRRSSAPAIGEARAEMMTTDLRSRLSAIKVRTLVLIPEMRSGKLPLDELKARFDKQYSGIEARRLVVIPKSGPYGMLDAPDRFNDEVIEFLRELPRRTS